MPIWRWNYLKNEEMEKTIIEKVQKLMEGEKTHRQSRIVEIETATHKRRGLLRGVQSDGTIVFSWIPELDPKAKKIEFTDMEIITILCEYRPEQILSIN